MFSKLFSKNNSTSNAKVESINSNELKSIVGGLDSTVADNNTSPSLDPANPSYKGKHDTAKNSINNVR